MRKGQMRPLCGGGGTATAGAAKRGVPCAELDDDSDAADVPRGERALGVAELREADVVHVVGRLHALDEPLLGRVEVERQHLRGSEERRGWEGREERMGEERMGERRRKHGGRREREGV